MSDRSGRIITFYSYKGGTGRTMAVSNVAWVLASNGYKVLLIDWDLEAPGLHRYLRPFLIDRELTHTPGLIDFVWDAARVSMTPAESEPKFPSLEDYVVGLDWTFRDDGAIDFIPAGRQDENYAQRVNTFNWDNFYERLGGGKLLEADRKVLRASYDYVLIDSRTGVSDTSSICTVHMPDSLVILFTLNRQSITGAAAIAASVRAQRPDEDFKIFPVPTRVENAESDKLAAATAYGRRVFAPFLRHVQAKPDIIDPSQQSPYWNEVETPYRTFYAFEEIPATFKDEPGSLTSVLRASERIAYWITDRAVASLQPENDERRKQVVDAYAFKDDETPRIEWALPPRAGWFKRLRRRLGAHFKKHGWRYATAVLAALAIFAGVEFGITSNTLEVTRTELAGVRDDLSTRTRQLGVANQTIADDEKKIADQVSKIADQNGQIGRLNGLIGYWRTRCARCRAK